MKYDSLPEFPFLLEKNEHRALLARYVDDAVKAERERCAKLCMDYAKRHAKDDDETKAQAWMMLQCAAAIRAQGEKENG